MSRRGSRRQTGGVRGALSALARTFRSIAVDGNTCTRDYEAVEQAPESIVSHEKMVAEGLVARANAPGNVDKNRYNNILPYDRANVAVKGAPFYNASLIDMGGDTGFGLDGERFIISQGPMHPE